jgi:hypothetical protein
MSPGAAVIIHQMPVSGPLRAIIIITGKYTTRKGEIEKVAKTADYLLSAVIACRLNL